MINVGVAQSIVDSMKEIIHQEINYFSIEGKVIASTDKKRIGQNHGGAKVVISTGKPLTINYDGEYKNVKQGINIPVLLNESIVGVIGITGKKNEVSQYGEIIKQMTEILIRDSIAKDIIFNKRNSHQFIIDYILGKNMEIEQNSGLMNFLYNTNFNINRVAISGILTTENRFTHQIAAKIYNELYAIIGNNENNIFDVRNGLITILIEVHSHENINSIIDSIILRLEKNMDADFKFGIGTMANSIESLKDSIQHSYNALSWNLNFVTSAYSYYEKMGSGIILHNILETDKDFFINKIFHNLTSEEIEDAIELLKVYEEHNGSINECASELFVHKNTVQYQLNKIHKLTNYNPRNLSDFFILKLASILYKTSN